MHKINEIGRQKDRKNSGSVALRRSQGHGVPINLENIHNNANSLNNSSELRALSPVGLIDRSNEMMSFSDLEVLESSFNLTRRGHMSRGSVREAITNRSSCSLITVASIKTNAINNANSQVGGGKPANYSGSSFKNHQ